MKSAALDYARLGIPVFPCDSNKSPLVGPNKDASGKKIVGSGGFHKATTDQSTIEKWWTRWPQALIGFPTGLASGIDVLDLDVDPTKKKNGLSEIPDWLKRSPVIVRTPRGGAHLWFKADEAIGCTTDEIAFGVDTRGRGGYAILPPSKNGAGTYRFEKGGPEALASLTPFPSDLAKRMVSRDLNRAPNEDATGDINLVKLALEALPNEALSWEEWNKIGMAIFAATNGEGLEIFHSWSQKSTKYSQSETRARWNHYFNSPPNRIGAGTLFYLANEAAPGWDEKYYDTPLSAINTQENSASARKWLMDNVWPKTKPKKAAAKSKKNAALKVEATAPAIEAPKPSPQSRILRTRKPGHDDLIKMNEKYSVVLDGGKVSVLMFERNIEQLGRHRHERNVPIFLSFDDFRNLHLNKFVFVPDKTKKEDVAVSLGTWWLKHPKRQQYDGLVFEPSGAEVISNRLNLWRGWGVKPVEGDWSLMSEHIRVVLASENEVSFKYILNWLAWAVQHPDRRAEVALVFKGGRGSGKGTLGNAMCRLFGQHGVHISNAKYLTGFNAHLRDACFLFADEAYWPGDKSAEGDLKRLITEPGLFIEAKRRDAVATDNMLHVMMASNEEWIVPAGEHERRFAAFRVNEKYLQNEQWFVPLHAQLEAGGYEAMLNYLMSHDLGNWHPRQIPTSVGGDELLNQQSRSLDPLDAWWVELLETGTLEGADPSWPCQAVSNEYQRELTGTEGRKFVRQRGLYDQARSIEPRLKSRNDHLLGHHLKNRGCSNDKKVLRRRGWTFPALNKLRQIWEARYPGWEWRDPEITEWRFEEDAPSENDKI